MSNIAEPEKYFPEDYYASRERFIYFAQNLGASLDHYESDMVGKDGQNLSVDTAYLGDIANKQILIINSGIHGVEGFAGAACQCALMDNISNLQAKSVSILLIHSLNPYGFSYLRRTNENNVDINRNFIDFKSTQSHNADYDRYHKILFPREWTTLVNLKSNFQLILSILIGRKKMIQSAITSGQYKYKKGLFYGGDKTSWSVKVCRQIFNKYHQHTLYLLDIHTGLGKFGQGNLLTHLSVSSPVYQDFEKYFKRRLSSTADGSDVSSSLVGTMCSTLPNSDNALVLEFGTRPGLAVLNALREENWRYWKNGSAKKGMKSKTRLKLTFTPNNDNWKRVVINQFMDITKTYLLKIERSV